MTRIGFSELLQFLENSSYQKIIERKTSVLLLFVSHDIRIFRKSIRNKIFSVKPGQVSFTNV